MTWGPHSGGASFLRTTKQQCYPQPSPAQSHATPWALLPRVSTPARSAPAPRAPSSPHGLPASGLPAPSQVQPKPLPLAALIKVLLKGFP